MGPDDLLGEVRADHPDADLMNDHVVFSYEIPLGGRRGMTIRVGLAVPQDWPLSCPPGPHISPRLGHPDGAVHASALGGDWEYWSRPFNGWANGARTFQRYMTHVRALLDQLP